MSFLAVAAEIERGNQKSHKLSLTAAKKKYIKGPRGKRFKD